MRLESALDSNRPLCCLRNLGSFVIIQLFGNLGIDIPELDEGTRALVMAFHLP
jgi:hypothetical protein